MPRALKIPSWWITPQEWTEALEARGGVTVANSADFVWKHGREVFGEDTHEEYRWIAFRFDVERAKQLIQQTPRPVIAFPLELMKGYVGKNPFLHVYDDGKRHMKDSEEMRFPIIVARMTYGERKPTKQRPEPRRRSAFIMVIDGWHRVFTALDLGLTHYPAVLLDEGETRLIAGIPRNDKM